MPEAALKSDENEDVDQIDNEQTIRKDGDTLTVVSEETTKAEEKKPDIVMEQPGAPLLVGESAVTEPVIVNRNPQEIVKGESGKFPWICPKCGKDYEYRSKLLAHIRTGHRDLAEQLYALVPGTPGKQTVREPSPPMETPKPPDFSDLSNISATAEAAKRQPAIQAVQSINYQQLAEMLFDTSAAVMTNTFGEEWKPKSADERTAVVGPLARYLESKQVQDVPPGMMLTIVVVAYSAPRLKAPQTAGKLKMGYLWLKSKIASRKKKV